MKRFLLAIAIGFLLVLTCLIISSVIFVLGGQNIEMIYYLDLPLRLPKYIVYYFSPPVAEDYSIGFTPRKAVLAVLVIGMNILIYSIPVYILLTIFSRRKSKNSPIETEPPAPPTFTN